MPKYTLGMETYISAEEANAIARFTKEILKKENYSTSVYAKAGSNAALLTIYGVTLQATQRRLIELIESKQKIARWRPIYIEFRKSEVWIEKPNGVGDRGEEEVLAVKMYSRIELTLERRGVSQKGVSPAY